MYFFLLTFTFITEVSNLVKDETGNKYGRLTVIKRGENDSQGNARWYC
jgi:hypothetical protein